MNQSRHAHSWPCCRLTLPSRIDDHDAASVHRQHHKALEDGEHVTVIRIDAGADLDRRLNNIEAWAINAGYIPNNPTMANRAAASINQMEIGRASCRERV